MVALDEKEVSTRDYSSDQYDFQDSQKRASRGVFIPYDFDIILLGQIVAIAVNAPKEVSRREMG